MKKMKKMVTTVTTETTPVHYARYSITYFDPEDEEGMRIKTWRFGTREEAEEWERELEVVWGMLEYQVTIRVNNRDTGQYVSGSDIVEDLTVGIHTIDMINFEPGSYVARVVVDDVLIRNLTFVVEA